MCAKPNIAILQASPRRGNSAYLADQIAKSLSDRAEVQLITLSSLKVGPCIGCDICQETGECFMNDDHPKIARLLQEVDGLILVTPIYFAGPPAQLKAFMDRFQFLWAQRYILKTNPRKPRRPLLLLPIGTGEDPFGFEPLVTIVNSSFRMVDLKLWCTMPLIEYESTNSSPHNAALQKQAIEAAYELVSRAEAVKTDGGL